ncbi:MAG: hypothetical protein KDA16_08205 [Phycisphaerales bacterium]|nr:hypothetical protein [Phycisphaerales bacterium]
MMTAFLIATPFGVAFAVFTKSAGKHFSWHILRWATCYLIIAALSYLLNYNYESREWSIEESKNRAKFAQLDGRVRAKKHSDGSVRVDRIDPPGDPLYYWGPYIPPTGKGFIELGILASVGISIAADRTAKYLTAKHQSRKAGYTTN